MELVRGLSGANRVDLYTLRDDFTGLFEFPEIFDNEYRYRFKNWSFPKLPFSAFNWLLTPVNLLRLKACCRMIGEEINRNKYDIVIFSQCDYTNVPLLIEFVAVPGIFFCQEPWRKIYEKKPVLRPYEKTLARRVSNLLYLPSRRMIEHLNRKNINCIARVLANSFYSKNFIKQVFGIRPDVNYLGVDTVRFRPLNLRREKFFLSVGALTKNKGFDFLIRAINCLPEEKRYPLVIIHNAADENERRYLNRLARSLNIKVEFKEKIKEEELVRHYNTCAAFLYAPYREPFGLVVLESQACGTPVVAVDEAGPAESIRNGETGFLVEREAKKFAGKIMELLGDEEKFKRMGRLARRWVERFWTWERARTEFEKYLEEVIVRG